MSLGSIPFEVAGIFLRRKNNFFKGSKFDGPASCVDVSDMLGEGFPSVTTQPKTESHLNTGMKTNCCILTSSKSYEKMGDLTLWNILLLDSSHLNQLFNLAGCLQFRSKAFLALYKMT